MTIPEAIERIESCARQLGIPTRGASSAEWEIAIQQIRNGETYYVLGGSGIVRVLSDGTVANGLSGMPDKIVW